MTTDTRGDDSNSVIQIRKILVPIDSSEFSLNSAKYATKLAKDVNAQLIFIHVIESIPYWYAPPEYREDVKKKVELWFNVIKDIAKTFAILDIKTEIFMDVNSVTESIIDYATTENIDLIVLGTRGRTGLKKFLMGSVANDVVRHAHCPVLLVDS
jgi:nucleotide-binding universal stress UspA family protein